MTEVVELSNPDLKGRRKIRVALIIGSLGLGGAERQAIQITQHLDKDRFETFLVSLSSHVPLAEERPEIRANLHFISKRWKYDVLTVFRLARFLRRNRIDIAHAFMFDAEIALTMGKPLSRVPAVVVSERNSDYVMKTTHKVGKWLAIRAATHCIANSHAGARFHSRVLKQDLARYSVVENGVDTEVFRPIDKERCRSDLGISPTAFVIGMFASFKPQKNHSMLLRALNELSGSGREVVALLVGDSLEGDYQGSNEYKREIQEQIDHLGIAPMIRVLGSRSDLAQLYSACDVTVLPSLHEGTPNVVLESLACNVPVVVTDVADNRKLIEDMDGCHLVRSGDSEELASVLARLASQGCDAETNHEARRGKIKMKYSNQQMADKLARVYEKLITEASRA